MNSAVLIAGFVRFGNVVGRILRGSTVHTTVLDHDADWIKTLRKFGLRTYYGDATREDLLRKAGVESARIVVVALGDMNASLQLVDTIQREFPRLEIFARAVDRIHAYGSPGGPLWRWADCLNNFDLTGGCGPSWEWAAWPFAEILLAKARE